MSCLFLIWQFPLVLDDVKQSDRSDITSAITLLMTKAAFLLLSSCANAQDALEFTEVGKLTSSATIVATGMYYFKQGLDEWEGMVASSWTYDLLLVLKC